MSEDAKTLMEELAKRYKAELKYSATCGKFYVDSNIEISDGIIREGICIHRDNPEDAIYDFNKKISVILM